MSSISKYIEVIYCFLLCKKISPNQIFLKPWSSAPTLSTRSIPFNFLLIRKSFSNAIHLHIKENIVDWMTKKYKQLNMVRNYLIKMFNITYSLSIKLVLLMMNFVIRLRRFLWFRTLRPKRRKRRINFLKCFLLGPFKEILSPPYGIWSKPLVLIAFNETAWLLKEHSTWKKKKRK